LKNLQNFTRGTRKRKIEFKIDLKQPLQIYGFLRKSNTTLVGPSPAPFSWMHLQFCLSRRRTCRGLARLLVLLPRRLHAGEGAVECVSAPCSRFRAEGAAIIALASWFQHCLNFNQLSLVVLHVFDELADGVVGAKNLLVDELSREVFSEEGGEGGGGDEGWG